MTSRFRSYRLERVLPLNQELVVNLDKHVLTLIEHTETGEITFLEQESFTDVKRPPL